MKSSTEKARAGALWGILSGPLLLGGCQAFESAMAQVMAPPQLAASSNPGSVAGASDPASGDADADADATAIDDAWLKDKPYVWNGVWSVDVPELVPSFGKVNLAEQAEPLEINGGRVDLERLGPNRFRLDLEFDPGRFESQRDDEWCWAACARMANEFNRQSDPRVVSLDQETLAGYFKRGEESQAANISTIMRALCLDLEPRHRKSVISLGADFVSIGPTRLVRDLSAGSMPIVGLLQEGGGGHAVVVTGVTYSWTRAGVNLTKTENSRATLRKAGRAYDSWGKLMETLDDVKVRKQDKRSPKQQAKRDAKEVAKAVKRAAKEAERAAKRAKKEAAKASRNGKKSKGHKDPPKKRDRGIVTEQVSKTVDVLDLLDNFTDAFVIESVTLLDPWSPEAPVVTLTGEQFRDQLDFIMTRELAYKLFTEGGIEEGMSLFSTSGSLIEKAGSLFGLNDR